ncbi:MAG: hypothetical protein ACREIW_15230, partial [Chthoniobacterales bacterium]
MNLKWKVTFVLSFVFLAGLSVDLILKRVDAQKLNNPERRVDQIFADYARSDSPGCVVGVIQNGEFIYRKGYGMGSLEFGVPLS